MAPDAVVHMPPLPDLTGIDAYRAAIADLRDALPNAHLTFDAVSTAGEEITARYTITGMHIAPSVAFCPPTGKAVALTGVMVAYLQDGQITELWDYADRFGLSLQLDQALPPPPTYVAFAKALAWVLRVALGLLRNTQSEPIRIGSTGIGGIDIVGAVANRTCPPDPKPLRPKHPTPVVLTK